MTSRLRLVSLFSAFVFFASLACAATDRLIVVTTTSVLGAAVQAIGSDRVVVETILPPGSCPGHFDLEPAQVRRLLSATLFLRHDFQRFFDERLLANGIARDRIVALPAQGGLCVPETFASLGRAAAEELAARLPSEAKAFRSRANELTSEAQTRGQMLRERVARLRGRPIAAAQHQADFLRWLGLDVRVVLPSNDDLSPTVVSLALAEIRNAHVVALVGNVPSGRRLPVALADVAGLPFVMFENFPASCAPADYWTMLDQNLDTLLKALPE
jgi:zinc transport system substrate-binding protein